MSFSEYEKVNILRSFEDIEKSILDFLDIIPYSQENLKVWSPKLATIIVDCGSLIDSIFRNSASATSSVRIRRTTKRKRDLDINDYKYLYSNKYNLVDLRTLLYVSPPKLLYPFKEWKNSQQNPQWWKDYNKIKHDRITNAGLATMKTTIDIASALFEIISQHPKMIEILSRYEWLDLGRYNPEIAISTLKSKTKSKGAHLYFIVNSKLFATTKGEKFFPNSIKSIKPALYAGSRKLTRFLNVAY